jgi:hypothetical protein
MGEVDALITKAVNDAQGIPDAEESTPAKHSSKCGHSIHSSILVYIGS